LPVGRGAARARDPQSVDRVNPGGRLDKLCGNGPDIWLRLQSGYDLRQAQKTMGKALAKIPTLSAAA